MIKGYPELPLDQLKELLQGLTQEIEAEVHHKVWTGVAMEAAPPDDGVLEVMRGLGGIIWAPIGDERPVAYMSWRLSDPYARWIAQYNSWWQSELHWIGRGADRGALRVAPPKKDYPLMVLQVLVPVLMALGLGALGATVGVGIWKILQ